MSRPDPMRKPSTLNNVELLEELENAVRQEGKALLTSDRTAWTVRLNTCRREALKRMRSYA